MYKKQIGSELSGLTIYQNLGKESGYAALQNNQLQNSATTVRGKNA